MESAYSVEFFILKNFQFNYEIAYNSSLYCTSSPVSGSPICEKFACYAIYACACRL